MQAGPTAAVQFECLRWSRPVDPIQACQHRLATTRQSVTHRPSPLWSVRIAPARVRA